MRWMQERDLLIAQTLAFVQSVTGKTPETDGTAAAPEAFRPMAAPKAITEVEAVLNQPPAPLRPTMPTQPIPALSIRTLPSQTLPVQTLPVQTPPQADVPGDFRSEIKARVANFRAHQQRFLREREEYCSETMAKVRASLRDGPELPRSPK
jgi:hypothetical protein